MESGETVKLKDMVFIYGRMVTNMKGNGSIASNMEMELTCLGMEMYILVPINMENLMVRDSINGQMEVCILESLRMDSNMGKENGEKILVQVPMPTTENTSKIRSMAKELLDGKVEMYILVHTEMMKGMVTERCSGQMGQYIKESGEEVFNTVREL